MTKASTKEKRKPGRPPRTDAPERIAILLPGELRRWLRIQAATEARDQGDVISDGLRLYRNGVALRRRGKS